MDRLSLIGQTLRVVELRVSRLDLDRRVEVKVCLSELIQVEVDIASIVATVGVARV